MPVIKKKIEMGFQLLDNTKVCMATQFPLYVNISVACRWLKVKPKHVAMFVTVK